VTFPIFGAGDVFRLVTQAQDDFAGIEELILGLFGALAGHLSTGCLESLGATVTGALADRPADG
jgi:hypothetical protein